MLQNETIPVSRVREIRMHGLKGGPALNFRGRKAAEG
jgi:hypothetical protein